MGPLKILHVANRAEKKAGRQFYSLPYKINNGLIRNGHNVVWFSDRDIARNSGFIKSGKLGRKKCNASFLEWCLNYRPDLIVFGHADIIERETIQAIRNKLTDLKIIQYNIDGLHIAHNVSMIASKAELVDMTFVTTAGKILEIAASAQSPAAFFPNPIDSSLEVFRCFENISYEYDVFFAGQPSNFCDETDLRNQVPKLPAALPDVSFGFFDAIWGAAYFDQLSQSCMGLNFSSRPAGTVKGAGGSLYYYSSDRISQYLGNGLLTISSGDFELAKLYGEDCLIEVGSFDELIEKIAFYKKEERLRRKIATRGHEIAHAEYNERLVAQYFVESVFQLDYSHAYAWPTDKYFKKL